MGDSSSLPSDNLGDSPVIELTGKIMIVSIIILFMVIVVALCFHLYARGFWWTVEDPPSTSRRGRRFQFAVGQDGALRAGLDPSVLNSLPVLVFQSQDFKDGLECAVCLSDLVEGEKARLLPKCNHGFHVDCIDMWFQSHSTCPLCRNPVVDDEDNQSSPHAQESPTFPTNVLVWGNHTQISSTGGATSLEEGASPPPCSSSSSSGSCTDDIDNRRRGMLVIDIPIDTTSTSLSPSASRLAEDELKSPTTGRLRSFKRLLSRDRRLNPMSPSSVDVEQAGGGQS
ncbi:hypothetical protein RJT34_20473 [Clitoria ternatea]|uniref:RING-type E3 ubiquitin transferase n=1 Tax=Clitoria ternatea TaxID=43366 RepID=A0AAN9P505_CLITE